MFSTRSGAARLSLFIVVGLIIIKVVVAVITGSISISAQAADSFLDLFAVVITLFAVRMASTPADEEHPFGHGKVEGIAAIVQAVLILTAAGLIIYSAVNRIITDSMLELTEAGIGVMLVSIIASVFLSRHLLRVAKLTDSIALEASARNIAADVYSAAGVLVGLVVIRLTGWNIVDPIIALGVALYILKAAWDVMKTAWVELVDVRLPKAEEDEIIACIEEHTTQLAGFHKVRTRKAGNQRFVDLHIMLPKDTNLEDAHQMSHHLEEDIKGKLPNSSITIHVEPCSVKCEQCLVSSCSLRIGIKQSQ